MNGEVGPMLRRWRANQGMSQLDLALTARVSSRHISFIETGRSHPSREMVLRLAESLGLPLRERNGLLLAAGFAPVYPERDLDAGDLAPIRRGLERVLRSHEPYPAFVLDRAWNVLLANRAHERLLPMLMPAERPLPEPVNVLELVLDPALLRPRVVNWKRVAHVLAHRLRRQLREGATTPSLRERFERMLDLPGVAEAMLEVQAPPESAVVIPLEFEFSGRKMAWFSTIATLGTPQDVALEELRIESLFPADEATERLASRLADGSA